MRLIIFDLPGSRRTMFHPLSLSRPVFELRCGITSLGEKLIERVGTSDVAFFVPPYMAESYRHRTTRPVNDIATLGGDDLLLVNGLVKASGPLPTSAGPSEVAVGDDGDVFWVRIARKDLSKLDCCSIEAILESARTELPASRETPELWHYIWELILANPAQLTFDFAALGRYGIEGSVEEPCVIRGSKKDVYIARGVTIHPMVVIDAEHGPVYIDEEAEIHPFTRIEGPCYIGKRSILLGAKCREGNSIGPMCRIGGEVEESIIQGYSNKYHDGFLGHAYLGEWVNLGAQTTNSDLKNDYSPVSVVLDGKTSIKTGHTKIGAMIGDHTKTSIGTLLNTGAYVGAMSMLVSSGRLMPKFIPSFSWCIHDVISEGFGRQKMYETARAAMARRNCQWTLADETLWEAIYELTAPSREETVRRGAR